MKYSLKHFSNLSLHVGHSKIYRSSFMDVFITGYRYNICILDIQQSQLMLRRALSFVVDLISLRGHVLFVGNFLYELYGNHYISNWTNGNITNISQVVSSLKGQGKVKYLPSAVVLLEETRAKYYILNECSIKKIPVVAITDTDMLPNMSFYPIPSNNDNMNLILFYKKLFSKAIAVGLHKQKMGFRRVR